MAQKKARKRSSSVDELRGMSVEELRSLTNDPTRLIAYVNRYVEEHAPEAERLQLSMTLAVRRRLLCELANTQPKPDRVRWFKDRWQATLFAQFPEDVVPLGEQLRFIWGRPSIDRAEAVLNEWLAWRPKKTEKSALGSIPFVCSLGAGRLVPDRGDLRAMLIQGVFENWRHLSVCANADCAAPYFIARRKDQVICDAEVCKAEKQRAHALKWWHENRGSRGGSSQP